MYVYQLDSKGDTMINLTCIKYKLWRCLQYFTCCVLLSTVVRVYIQVFYCMLYILIVNIFDSEIINNEGEGDISGDVFEESIIVVGLDVSVLLKVCN